ncbi:MAG: zinc-binding dehydrogenase [Deltaproteobacteria bacterium]|nr:zinc-binding dehydrogenase [Deltaproteobacteria bacterium]
MNAIVIHQYGGRSVLSMEQIDIPTPGDGELLVKVFACGVNPVDYKIRAGMIGLPREFPSILGYDISGRVAKVGKGVNRFKPDDDVFFSGQITDNGGYAEYCVVNESIVARKPENISHPAAATIPLSGQTAWEALFERAGVKAGESVLIHAGAGGVGSLAIQLAKWKGLTVFTTASQPQHIEMARQFGADHVINYKEADFVEAVHQQTNGDGVDVVFDTVGGDVFGRNFEALKVHGRAVCIVEREAPYPLLGAWFKNATIHTLFMERNRERLDQLAKLVREGRLKPVVETTLPLTDAARAHEMVEGGHVGGKVVLVVGD